MKEKFNHSFSEEEKQFIKKFNKVKKPTDENAYQYQAYMKEYIRLRDAQFIRKENTELSNTYEKLKAELLSLSKDEVFDVSIKPVSEFYYDLTIRYELLVSQSECKNIPIANVLGLLMLTFKDFWIEVDNEAQVKMSFDIKLYDEVQVADYSKQLNELNTKMKMLLRENNIE